MAEATTQSDRLLDDLDSALSALVEARWMVVPREELADVVCRVESSLATKMDAVRAAVVVAADDAAVGLVDRARTTDQLVSGRTGVDPARVRADGRLGRWLEAFPVFAEAFGRGVLSRDHLEQLRKSDNVRNHLSLIESQQMLLDAAKTVDWRDWSEVVRYWLLAADPDGDIPKEQLRNRRMSMTKLADGSWTGKFRLDAVSGQILRNAVAMEEQLILDEDAELGIFRQAADRQVDALVRIVGRGAARTNRELPAPLVHLVIGKKLAEDMVRQSITGDSTPFEMSQSDVDRRCEFADGTPVHPNAALAVLAVAKFIRLVLAPNSRPLNLGRSTRSFPKDIKMAMMVAARGRCRTPGCDAPYAWLQADHRTPWTRHGLTNIDNGDALCGPDNRFKGDK